MAVLTDLRTAAASVDDCSALETLCEMNNPSLRPRRPNEPRGGGANALLDPPPPTIEELPCSSPATLMLWNCSNTVGLVSALLTSNPVNPISRYFLRDLAISVLDPYCDATSK